MDKTNHVASNNSDPSSKSSSPRNLWAWFNLTLTLVLFIVGIWYLVNRVSLAEIGSALSSANLLYILLSLGTTLLTLWLKTWRWQIMFPFAKEQPSSAFSAFFWALMLGAYINVLVPFLRLGEVARIVTLDQLTGISKAQSLTTLVLEKTLDMIMLGLTLAFLLTAVVVPGYLNESSATLVISVAAVGIFLGLGLIAWRTDMIISLTNALLRRLPPTLSQRLYRWTVAGLAGLAALRDKKLAMRIIVSSAIIAVISVLTPLLLLYAFHLPLGWVAAAAIHITVSVALVPPTTPAKIGIFDGVVAFLLIQFGLQNEALIASYTITYHLVLFLPLILLGPAAASRTQSPIHRRLL